MLLTKWCLLDYWLVVKLRHRVLVIFGYVKWLMVGVKCDLFRHKFILMCVFQIRENKTEYTLQDLVPEVSKVAGVTSCSRRRVLRACTLSRVAQYRRGGVEY